MPITGLESKANSALSELRGSDHVIQQVGVVVRDLATAVEQLSREVDDLKNTCGTSSARPTTTSKTSSTSSANETLDDRLR